MQSTQRDFHFYVGLEDETSSEKLFLTHTGNMHVLMPKTKILYLQLCAQGEMLQTDINTHKDKTESHFYGLNICFNGERHFVLQRDVASQC